jgi:hypothetical protein
MYPNADGYAFDFDKNLRGDTLRVTPTHAQVSKVGKGPEFDKDHHDMYPGTDGYNFDYDYPRGQDKPIIDVINRPRLA